jgi:curved DNA-binding protein CbpA
MPDPYTVLGVAPDADDEAIRRRYLELIREFPPEHHGERFSVIRAAYEKVKDIDARVRYRLFDAGREDTIESIIEEVACRTPRRRISLKELMAAERAAG